MPVSPNTLEGFQKGHILPEKAHRSEKLLGTNCALVELLSFVEDNRVIRVISKKSRLPAHYLSLVQQEYQQLKHHLGDLIPSGAFFLENDELGRGMVTAFCSPVSIAYDIFASDENWNIFKKEIDTSKSLQDDIDMFIFGYKKLRGEGFYVDLWGDENLVITREGRLKYIDSFSINMQGRKTLKSVSEERFAKIEKLSTLPS
ncbi:hypothetical protein H7170_00015 [Candidatus Gracilibacteria bacterium]|nr:hypothetical protein [Candidatus Gracilibacteria bacterium]